MHQRNNETAGGRGRVFTEKYMPSRIERLKNIVRDFEAQGKRKYYSIIVDGETVVAVNSDYRNFDQYKRYTSSQTQSIEVRMMHGNSPNCNRHVFYTSASGLGGVGQIDHQTLVSEALEKQRMEYRIEELQKQLKRKTKKLREYKTLQEELDKGQIDIKDLLAKGIELYGQFTASRAGAGGGAAPTVQGAPVQSEVEITAEETKSDRMYGELKAQYSEKQLEKAVRTWKLFAQHPELREEFMAIINQKNSEDGKA